MTPLILALPSKGRLKEQTEAWLADCGLPVRAAGGERGYSARLEGLDDIEVRLLSAAEIATGLFSGQIHLGVTGPKNLQLAGAIADGVILSTMSSPEYVRFAREQLRLGAERAGRTLEGFEVSAILPISISEDEKEAREAVKPLLAVLLGIGAFEATSPILRCVEFPETLLRQFTERFRQGEIPVELVTDQVIDSFAIAGSPARCRKRMAEFVAAGVDVPIAYEIPGINPEEMIASLKRHLVPEFS